MKIACELDGNGKINVLSLTERSAISGCAEIELRIVGKADDSADRTFQIVLNPAELRDLAAAMAQAARVIENATGWHRAAVRG